MSPYGLHGKPRTYKLTTELAERPLAIPEDAEAGFRGRGGKSGHHTARNAAAFFLFMGYDTAIWKYRGASTSTIT